MPLKYQRFLKPYARSLRNTSTLGEILLWNELKQRKLSGCQFYRQKPLFSYIVDFYCPAVKLVIEIDGKYHNDGEQQIKDGIRQQQLEVSGIHFLRFTEHQVRAKMPWVLECIEDYIESFRNSRKSPCS
jgi:very-short-patch-repair endonuclease